MKEPLADQGTEQGAGLVLIADDHPLIRDALRQVVADALPGHAIREANCLEAALAAAESEDPDLILLDINMPGMHGFRGLISLRNACPAAPVIVVSADERPETVSQAITLGASGFMAKSMERSQMAEALLCVLAGDLFAPAPPTQALPQDNGEGEALTSQQRKVLELLAAGKANKIIAYELGISERTVKAHVSAILRKLNVTSRTQAVLNASRLLGR